MLSNVDSKHSSFLLAFTYMETGYTGSNSNGNTTYFSEQVVLYIVAGSISFIFEYE
jgi:hypothetical protein